MNQVKCRKRSIVFFSILNKWVNRDFMFNIKQKFKFFVLKLKNVAYTYCNWQVGCVRHVSLIMKPRNGNYYIYPTVFGDIDDLIQISQYFPFFTHPWNAMLKHHISLPLWLTCYWETLKIYILYTIWKYSL